MLDSSFFSIPSGSSSSSSDSDSDSGSGSDSSQSKGSKSSHSGSGSQSEDGRENQQSRLSDSDDDDQVGRSTLRHNVKEIVRVSTSDLTLISSLYIRSSIFHVFFISIMDV